LGTLTRGDRVTSERKGGERWPRWLAFALVLVGGVLRLRQYLAARPLWLDEASLALNILPRSFHELTKTLDFEQVAPVPFLWMVKASTVAFGPGELALRCMPLLAGIALLVVVASLSREVLGERWGLAPLALTALSPTLIYYSNELKPYATDALAATLLIWLVARVRGLPLALGGGLLLLISFPTVFVAAAAIVVLKIEAIRFRSLRGLVSSLGIAVVWIALFAAGYQWSLAHGGSSPYLQRFWAASFIDGPRSGWDLFVAAAQQNLIGTPHHGFEGVEVGIALLLAVLGAVHLVRAGGHRVAILLGLPTLGAFAASLLQLYPVSARTLLFAVPSWLVLIAMGVRAIPLRGASALALAGVLLMGLVVDGPRFAQPRRREDLRPLVERFHANKPEAVYVYARSIPAWTYLTTDWVRPDWERLEFVRHLAASDGPCFENASSRGHAVVGEGDGLESRRRGEPVELFGLSTGVGPEGPRVPDPGWAENESRRIRAASGSSAFLVFSHVVERADSLLLTALEAQGAQVVERVPAEGASGYLVTWRLVER
jgi:hypothetical protein